MRVAEFVGRSTLVAARREGERAAIELGGITQFAPVTSTATGGGQNQRLTAVIRPEMVALAPAGAPENWPGRVESRRYAGANYVYRVTVPTSTPGQETAAFEIACDEGRYAEGSEVGVKLLGRPIALLAP